MLAEGIEMRKWISLRLGSLEGLEDVLCRFIVLVTCLFEHSTIDGDVAGITTLRLHVFSSINLDRNHVFVVLRSLNTDGGEYLGGYVCSPLILNGLFPCHTAMLLMRVSRLTICHEEVVQGERDTPVPRPKCHIPVMWFGWHRPP